MSAANWHGALLVVPVASALYDVLAQAALRHWLAESPTESGGPWEPVTFFKPLKRGVPKLREKLASLVVASLPGDQIIFGVEEGSEEETMAEEVRRNFPQCDIAVVRCRPDAAVNPKIAKLVQMEALARHEAWLLSDSEVIFTDRFPLDLRSEWHRLGPAALTTGYRFANAVSWPQRCDALALLLGLWPGLALVRRFGTVRFTLGACTLVRRAALEAVGGWRAFAEELAEDQRLGAALAAAGGTVRLSRQIATLESEPMSWGDYWRHQRRVAVTYRVASPAGFAGVILTFGPVWSATCALAFPHEPQWVLIAFISSILRMWNLRGMARLLECELPGLAGAFGIVSVVEALCWMLSWGSARVWWGGRRWRVDFRGNLST